MSSYLAMTIATNDELLMRNIYDQNTKAMAILFSRYSLRVYRVALRTLRNHHEAEDVMQDVFLKLWCDPDSFVQRQNGTLRSWLCVVARHKALDLIRRRKPDEPNALECLLANTDLERRVIETVDLATIDNLVKKLPPKQRTALELVYGSELSHPQVATKLGDPVGTVKTRIRVGLIAVRTALLTS